jgi:hypothetical protein
MRLAERLGGVVEAAGVAREGNGPIRLRAGYCAVSDFGASDVDAVELLLRATTALRELRESGDPDRVREFAAQN